MLSSNLVTKFRNSKWWPQNWQIFERNEPYFRNTEKITFKGFLGMLTSNLKYKFQKSKWRPQNLPLIEKNKPYFYTTKKITFKSIYGGIWVC